MASKQKPARNRLRRSCDVCFKSKTKCDDHRPCNQCIRRKCEDRCLTSGQSPSVSNSGQRRPATPLERKAKSETRPRKTNGVSTANGTPVRASSQDVSSESQELSRSVQQPGSSQTHNSHQAWTQQARFAAESPFAASLNYEQAANNHAGQTNGNGSLEHTWNAEGPGKGRTHYLWLLRKFGGILPYIDEEARNEKIHRHPINSTSYGHPENPRNIEQHRTEILATVFNEIPKQETCIGLIDLYFSTYARIFPILDHNEFEKSYHVVMSSPEVFVRDINFVVMLLLVLLLGNTLLDVDRQGIPLTIVARWMALVQAWNNKLMESGLFGFEQIHTFVLFNLARQVTRVNPEADYVSLGSAIRAAMLNGTHKPPELLFGTGYTARVPWTALIELDLQGSIGTGLLPTTAPLMAQDEQTRKSSSLFINEIWTALANTIHLRHDILVRLNSDLKVKHQHAIDLARELTTVVSPILRSSRRPESVFAYEYLNFIYKRYLFALHRPFALMDDPAYHFSQRICSSLSFQHIERLCRINSTSPTSRSPFENLLLGYNSMFWEESFQSTMFLCHSLLRTQSVEDEIMDTIMLGDEPDRHNIGNSNTHTHSISSTSICMTLHAYLSIAAHHLKEATWLAEQAYLVPAITLAYLEVSKQFSEGKNAEEWEAMWKDTQIKVVNRCLELEGSYTANGHRHGHAGK